MDSFIHVEAGSHFPLQNLPYGTFTTANGKDDDSSNVWRVGCAIGGYVLDLAELHRAGLFKGTKLDATNVFHQ
eukprot:scaffold250685_cov42-Prasinocladus_malaysianus.AAC.1